MENNENLDPEIVRTKGRTVALLIRNKEPIVEACQKVQLSTRQKAKTGGYEYKTEIIESPCKRIDGNFCRACAFPNLKWKQGICNLASHLYIENKKDQPLRFITPITMEVKAGEEEKFLNPLKRSKRRFR